MTSAVAPRAPAARGPRRPTALELFFDLVLVFALTRISTRAVEDLALSPGGADAARPITGGGKTLLLLLALWGLWHGTAWTTSRADPHHIWVQMIVVISLVSGMVMGVAILRAYTQTGLLFAGAYVTAQLGRSLILVLALAHHEHRRLRLQRLLIFCLSAVPWLAGAFVSTNPRVVLWTVALGVEFVGLRATLPVPWSGGPTPFRWQLAGEHFAERYQQIFLVALGESILVAGFAYSVGARPPARTAAFALALAASVLLWRIYFQRAGEVLAEAVNKAKRPELVGRAIADAHLVMVVGVVATAIGYELTIDFPLERPDGAWIALIVGGPVLFLVGRARFEYEVFGRVPRSRWIAMLALAAFVPVLVGLPTLVASGTSAAVLLAVAVADARRAWRRPPEPARPPM